MTEVELPPGAAVSFPAASYSFMSQIVWVLAGHLTFVEGDTTHDLGARRFARARAAGRLHVPQRRRGRVPLSRRGAEAVAAMDELADAQPQQRPAARRRRGAGVGRRRCLHLFQLEERAPQRLEADLARHGAVSPGEGRGARTDLRGIHARTARARPLSAAQRHRRASTRSSASGMCNPCPERSEIGEVALRVYAPLRNVQPALHRRPREAALQPRRHIPELSNATSSRAP